MAEDSGRATPGETAAFRVANLARQMNNSNYLTYSTKLMAATDDAFGYIMGRAKMREKAMRKVLELQDNGYKTPKITKELMRAYEDDFYAQIFDANGNIIDEATKFARKEVTLPLQLAPDRFTRPGLDLPFSYHLQSFLQLLLLSFLFPACTMSLLRKSFWIFTVDRLSIFFYSIFLQ